MSRLFRTLVLLVGIAAAGGASAADFRPFDADSLTALRTAHAGRPFALVLWSLDCTYCRDELALLARFKQRNPRAELVLVATDGPEARPALEQVLKNTGWVRPNAWLFAGDEPERVRWSIDRKWHGELPRTYLFDSEHRATAISGTLSEERLSAWLRGASAAR